MFGTTNQVFDATTRIGQDPCALDQASIQNMKACNYATQNYFAGEASLNKSMDVATSHAGFVINGGYGMGVGGFNVDESSRMQIGAVQGNSCGRNNLFHRPFATVPYLGRGAVDPNLESQLLNRNVSMDRRASGAQPCTSSIRYHRTPLIPMAKKRISAMGDNIMSNEEAGFRFGGVDTRNDGRDANCEY
jgi:hypothetical protein